MQLKFLILAVAIIFCSAQTIAPAVPATAAAPAAAAVPVLPPVAAGVNIAMLKLGWQSWIQAFLPSLMCRSTEYTLPDFEFMGFEFNNAKFDSLTIDPSKTTIQLNNGWMTVTSNNMAFKMEAIATQRGGQGIDELESATLKQQTPGKAKQTKGTSNGLSQPVTITTTNAMMTFGMSFFQVNGRAQFKIDNVTTDVGNLQVNAQQGFLSKISTQLTSNPDIKKKINAEFQDMLKGELPMTLNRFGMEYPTQQQIYNTRFTVDDSLVQDPVITPIMASLFINGTIFVTEKGMSSIPFAPTAMPEYDPNAPQEFQMFLNDYFFNSGLQNAWNAGFLTFTFPDDFDKFGIPMRKMTTDDLQKWFPDVVTTYGSGTNTRMTCSDIGGNAPTFKSTDQNIIKTATLDCTLSAYQNNAWVKFLDWTGDYTFTGKLALQNGNMLEFDIMDEKVANIKVNSSQLSGVDATSLQTMVNGLFQSLFPMKKSFQLPIAKWVSLTNPVISYHNGYTEIVSNAQFQPMQC